MNGSLAFFQKTRLPFTALELQALGGYFICLTKPSHTARYSGGFSRAPLVVVTFKVPTARVVGF